mgnify:CR=1 FL=1
MCDDDDGDLFPDAFEIGSEPALLGLVNPTEVVAGFGIESDGVEVDEVPSEVGMAVVRILVAELFDKKRFAVFRSVFWEVGKFAPASDVVIADGVVARDAKVFESVIEHSPFFCD